MATYNSPTYANNKAAIGHGLNGNMKVIVFDQVTCTAAPTTSDTINFGWVPANFVVLGAVLRPSDMDTSGSPTLTLNIGDSGSASRLFSAATGGQTGTNTPTMAAGSLGYKYTAKTLITGTAAANATTGAAGTIDLALYGYIADSTTS